MTSAIESLMYAVSNTFLLPILVIIIGLFIYSVFLLGAFIMQMELRRKNKEEKKKGFPVYNHAVKERVDHSDDLEIFAYKKLENTAIVTRVAPMLGLVATMIPMGPALKALANGNIQGISENLIIAFGAVIFSLITASITFWITSVRKRWYATEIRTYMKGLEE